MLISPLDHILTIHNYPIFTFYELKKMLLNLQKAVIWITFLKLKSYGISLITIRLSYYM